MACPTQASLRQHAGRQSTDGLNDAGTKLCSIPRPHTAARCNPRRARALSPAQRLTRLHAQSSMLKRVTRGLSASTLRITFSGAQGLGGGTSEDKEESRRSPLVRVAHMSPHETSGTATAGVFTQQQRNTLHTIYNLSGE